MSNFKALTARECAKKILEINNPVILIHIRPDGDAVGSAAALAEIFRQLGRSAPIMCEHRIPDRLRFILEHTSTEVCNNGEGRTAISIDVASPAQLGALWDKAPSPTLMIDHHAMGTPFADHFILPDASSAGEVLFSVIEELVAMGRIVINERLAYPLYASISSDTGRFAYASATPRTYKIAASLMEYGIDWADINHRLFNSKSQEQIKAEGFVASRMKLDGNISYATITLEEREKLGILEEHLETAIEVVRAVLGAECSFFLRELEKGKYKASIRSVKKDVARIAAKFGGGGHILAAGCTVTASSIEEAAQKLILELK